MNDTSRATFGASGLCLSVHDTSECAMEGLLIKRNSEYEFRHHHNHGDRDQVENEPRTHHVTHVDAP